MANGWSKEMQAALQADAEKLSAESGEEHKIVFSDDFDPLNEIERLRAAAAGEQGGEGTEWFWRIVDAHGLADVPSDEGEALRLILRRGGFTGGERGGEPQAEIERLRAAAAGEQGGEGWMRVPQGFVIAVNEFLADWQKGDFSLSTLAALDVQSIIEAKERWADALAAG